MSASAVLTWLLLTSAVGDGTSTDLYQRQECLYSGGRYENAVFHYRLLDPRTADRDAKYPLLVWLHGEKEAGDDNSLHMKALNTLVTPLRWKPGRFPLFVLALQCPRDNAQWCEDGVVRADDMLSVLAVLVRDTLERYPIDPDRVVLAGISAGGAGCWQFAARAPGLFAAVAPLSAGSFVPIREQLDAVKDTPIWVFNSVGDSVSPIKDVRALVETLAAETANIYLTEIPGSSHDSWTSAFTDYGLLNWLLAQRRGDATSPPPGSISWFQATVIRYRGPALALVRGWHWPQVAALCFLVTVVVITSKRVCARFRLLPTVRVTAWRSSR